MNKTDLKKPIENFNPYDSSGCSVEYVNKDNNLKILRVVVSFDVYNKNKRKQESGLLGPYKFETKPCLSSGAMINIRSLDSPDVRMVAKNENIAEELAKKIAKAHALVTLKEESLESVRGVDQEDIRNYRDGLILNIRSAHDSSFMFMLLVTLPNKKQAHIAFPYKQELVDFLYNISEDIAISGVNDNKEPIYVAWSGKETNSLDNKMKLFGHDEFIDYCLAKHGGYRNIEPALKINGEANNLFGTDGSAKWEGDNHLPIAIQRFNAEYAKIKKPKSKNNSNDFVNENG